METRYFRKVTKLEWASDCFNDSKGNVYDNEVHNPESGVYVHLT